MNIEDHELPEGALLLEPRSIYDKAIIGYNHSRIVYDHDQVIVLGIEEYGSYEDSLDWHSYNTFGCYMGEGTPIFITRIDQ